MLIIFNKRFAFINIIVKIISINIFIYLDFLQLFDNHHLLLSLIIKYGAYIKQPVH